MEPRIGEESEPEVFAADINANVEATAVAFSSAPFEYTENEEPGSSASSESEDENRMGRRENLIVDAVGMNVSFFAFIFATLYFI